MQGNRKPRSIPGSPKKMCRKLSDGKMNVQLTRKTNLMSSLTYLNLENPANYSVIEQSLPRVWSNPQISEHIRY